ACPNFTVAVECAGGLRLPPGPRGDRCIAGKAAPGAGGMAGLHALARDFAGPLSARPQLLCPQLHCPRDRIRFSAAVTSSDGLKLKLVAWAYRLYGFAQVKVKVGIAGQDDVARLRAVRRRVGPKVRLRIDANEAWPAAQAGERMRALEPFGLEYVEQPLPHGELASMP